MIPHVIHQFWDRPEPPADVAACIATWRAHHPSFAHILWNDDSAASLIRTHFGVRAARCFAAAAISSMRSDLLRLAALIVVGGIYADADTRCLRPLGRLLKLAPRALFESKFEDDPYLRMGLILAEPHHPLLLRFWDAVLDAIESGTATDVGEVSGPPALNRLWRTAPQAERAAVTVITARQAKRFAVNERNLAYRREGHWMTVQKRTAIIDFSRAARIDKVERIRARAAASPSSDPKRR